MLIGTAVGRTKRNTLERRLLLRVDRLVLEYRLELKTMNSTFYSSLVLVVCSFIGISGIFSTAVKGSDRIQQYLHGNLLEKELAAKELFSNASRNVVSKLQENTSDAVAIRAAWELVGRRVADGRGDSTSIVSAPSGMKEYLARFVGYVEGKLSLTAPPAWAKLVTNATVVTTEPSDGVGILIDSNTRPTIALGQYLVTPGYTVTRDPKINAVTLKKEGKSIGTIPSISSHANSFALASLGNEIVAVIYDRSSTTSGGEIVRISDEKVVWRQAHSSPGGGAFGKLGNHLIEVRATQELITLFGATPACIYVEQYEQVNGKQTLSFSSMY
jgi:hypothetical protein